MRSFSVPESRVDSSYGWECRKARVKEKGRDQNPPECKEWAVENKREYSRTVAQPSGHNTMVRVDFQQGVQQRAFKRTKEGSRSLSKVFLMDLSEIGCNDGKTGAGTNEGTKETGSRQTRSLRNWRNTTITDLAQLNTEQVHHGCGRGHEDKYHGIHT